MNSRKTATDIFLAGVESVKPDNLIKRYVSLKGNTLTIDTLTWDVTKLGHIYIVGAGKASALMAQTMESILGNKISEGHIVAKYDHSCPLKTITITEAAHPVPDENGLKGTEKILSIAKKAGKDDLVICLISGGGSALLADVPEGCTLDDLKKVNDLLLKSGADITEMNCIRKHLSAVKGGQLAKAIAPATAVSLILSDVIGDPLDVIASGPTAPDPTTFEDAIGVITNYGIESKVPARIKQLLQDGYTGKRPETLKEHDEVLKHTHNLIIGTNKLALDIAKQKAESLGFETQIITHTLSGDAGDAATYIANMAKSVKEAKGKEKICLLFAGEPTVKVTGKGLGGRNQHLALVASTLVAGIDGITILSGGTDGSDGPTDAAGAVSDAQTAVHAKNLGLSVDQFISDCDSYHFFQKEGGLIITGPTQTNVMDLIVVLVE